MLMYQRSRSLAVAMIHRSSAIRRYPLLSCTWILLGWHGIAVMHSIYIRYHVCPTALHWQSLIYQSLLLSSLKIDSIEWLPFGIIICSSKFTCWSGICSSTFATRHTSNKQSNDELYQAGTKVRKSSFTRSQQIQVYLEWTQSSKQHASFTMFVQIPTSSSRWVETNAQQSKKTTRQWIFSCNGTDPTQH